MTSLPGPTAPLPVVGHESGGLFDPRVVVLGAGEPPSSAAAGATTSSGREVRASARVAAPPATSYVHVHTGDTLVDAPSVLAAHGELLLIRMRVHSCREDWFVYRLHAERPWLRRLPRLDCLASWAQEGATGIVSLSGGSDFVVAGFGVSVSPDASRVTADIQESAELLRYSSATRRWERKPLAMPYDGHAVQPFRWNTDRVLSSSDGSMYWVDYHRGLLRCNVGESSPCLQFIRLPGAQLWALPIYFQYDRIYREAYRTVGDCKGTVKFVHVDNGVFGTVKRSGFTVTTWALKMPELEWDKIAVLQVDAELWTLPNFQGSTLPRWVPQFPMVSTQDDDVLHFILQKYQCDYEDWMITINMRQKALLSYEYRTVA